MMAKYDLSYQLTLKDSNMVAVSQAIAALVTLVGPVGLRIDYDTSGADDEVDETEIFDFFKNKVGAGSIVTLAITEES
jgi:hypothetical protein